MWAVSPSPQCPCQFIVLPFSTSCQAAFLALSLRLSHLASSPTHPPSPSTPLNSFPHPESPQAENPSPDFTSPPLLQFWSYLSTQMGHVSFPRFPSQMNSFTISWLLLDRSGRFLAAKYLKTKFWFSFRFTSGAFELIFKPLGFVL